MKKFAAIWLICALFSAAEAKESPWSAWRLAYSEYEKAEKARDRGDYLEAAQSFQKALEFYQSVRKARPDWNQKVILRRIDDCSKELAKVRHFLAPEEQTAPVSRTAFSPSEAPSERQKRVSRAEAPVSPEVAGLRKKAADLELEIQLLRRREESRKNLESEIALLIRDRHIAKEKYAMLEEKLRQAEKRNAPASEEARAGLEKQLIKVKMESESAKDRLAEAEEKLRTASELEEKLRRQAKFADAALKAGRDERLRLERESADLRRSEAENREKREELDRRVEGLESDRTKLAEELKSTREALDASREKLRKIGGDPQKAGPALAAENRALSEKWTALQAKYEILQSAFSDLKREATAEKNFAARMKSVAERGENVRQMLEKKNQAQERAIGELRAETTRQMEEIAGLKAKTATLQNELSAAVRQKERLDRRLQQRDSDDYRATADIGTQRGRWESEREKLRQEIARLTGEISRVEILKKESDDQLKEMTSARRKALDELSALQSRLAGMDSLQEKLHALQRNFDAAQKELRADRAALAAAEEEKKELLRLRDVAVEAEKLKAKLSEEQRRNEELASANADLTLRATEAANYKSEMEKLRAEVARTEELRAAVVRLQKLNGELAKKKDLEAELAAAKQKIVEMDSLRAALDAGKKYQKELSDDLARKNAQIAGNEEKIREKDEELARRNATIAENETARRASQKLFFEQEQQRLRLEKSLTQTKRLLEESEKQCAAANARAAELETRQTAAAKNFETAEKERRAEKMQFQQELARRDAQRDESARRTAELLRQIGALLPLKEELAKLRAEHAELARSKIAEKDEKRLLEAQQLRSEQLRSELAKKEEDFRKLQADFDLKEAERKETEKRFASEKAAQKAEAERELGTLRDEVKLLRGQTERNEQMQAEAEKSAALRREIGDLRKNLEKMHALAEENDRLQKELRRGASLQEEKEKLARRAAQAEEKVVSLQNRDALLRQSQMELKLAREDAEKLRALNAELVKLKELEKEIAQLKSRLAEAERFQAENGRLRTLNEALRKENATLNLAVLKPTEEHRYGFDSASALTASSDVLIVAGMRAEKEGRTATAIWNYENALKKSPNNPMAARKLGLLLLRREEFDRASKVLALAYRLAPDDFEVALGAATACNRCQRYGIAAAVIEPYLQEKNPDVNVLLIAGEAYAGSGKRDKAEKLLRFARSSFPDDDATGIALAKFLAQDVRREDEALQLYETLRRKGVRPDPELEVRFAGKLDERRELAAFLNSAAEEAAARNDWATVLWYRRQSAELKRDEKEESAQLAFARYMNGDTAAALEELSLHPASVRGELVAALCHLRDREIPPFRQAIDHAKSLNGGAPIELPPEWRTLLVELKKCALSPEGSPILNILK